MKRYLRLLSTVLMVVILLSLFSCSGIKPNKKQATVYIATDIHLFSDNLIGENNQIYHKDRFVSDGRIQEYDYELVGALIDEVNSERPEFLVLTGDLTFNGEKDSHYELARLLKGVSSDTRVLVIPGNHDVYSQAAVSVYNDTVEPTESIDASAFREIYSDFGYSDGYSYDENSLSYIYAMSDDRWALMLDTNLSKYNAEYGYNVVGGGIEKETMDWLESNLAYARENDIEVISFTHHNLLVHNKLFETGYTLGNAEELLKLYAKYEVSLNFSGHLHIQSIESQEIEGSEIYDVSGGSLLDFGNRYGRLEIYDNCYSYESRELDLSGYDTDIRAHSFDTFCNKYYSKTLWTYQGKLGQEDGEEATRLLSEINAYYFDGSYGEIRKLVMSHPLAVYRIKNSTPDYDSSYVKSIIDVEKEDQHSLLIPK